MKRTENQRQKQRNPHPPGTGHGRRIGFVFRYGVTDHAELYPAIPLLLKALGEKHQVFYFGGNRRRLRPELNLPGVQYIFAPISVNRASMRDKLVKALLWYLFLPGIGLMCRRRKLDLIWIDESALPGQTLIIQLFSGRPVMQTVADFFAEVYAETKPWLRPLAALSRRLDEAGWRRAACLLTHTFAGKEYLEQHGIPAEKTAMVRDAVLPDLFCPCDAQDVKNHLGIEPEDVVLCHHGILHPNKGLDRVLHWLAPLMKSDPRLKFMIIGTGPEQQRLSDIAARLDIAGRVIFTGWLPTHQELNRYLNAADIGLVMRAGHYTDHFHVTGALIHSMMVELPVLAVRLRGIAEIVRDGEEGFLFDPFTGEEFQHRLRTLAADSALRREMGRRGRQRALAEFSADVTARRLEEVIEEVMEGRFRARTGSGGA